MMLSSVCTCCRLLQTFHGDFDLKDRDFRVAAAQALADMRGKPVSPEVLRRLMQREEVRGAHQVLASQRVKGLKLDPLTVVDQVEQQQHAEQQAAAV